MGQVFITDTTLRDAHQCLIATRMRTKDMLPICQKMDSIGFWALEVWGGATFDACLRFLKEDPWERLKQLRKAIPNTRLSMLLRGQNLVGYRHYGDDVVDAFIKLAAKNGVDVFRIFDALNDVRNLKQSIAAVKSVGKHAQGAISYTTSPVHDIGQFVDMGQQLQDLGCDSLAIKDMAGLLTPINTEQLFKALSSKIEIPIHIHSHSTSGLASICHYKAVECGCRHIDTAISAFAEGASHPCTESMVSAFKDSDHDTHLDLSKLLEIGEYFKQVRKKYHQFESEATAIDPRVQLFQVPGGMISNLYNQLKEQNALDKLELVHQEIPRVRKELGYPPLVTPTSQVVGTQAVLNVLTGERYKTITNEVKLYCQGKYGRPPAPIDSKVSKKAIGNTEMINVRPASLIQPELVNLSKQAKPYSHCEEDVLSYAMFPEVAKKFFEERNAGQLHPEPLLEKSVDKSVGAASDFTISLHGEEYRVKVKGSGKRDDSRQTFYLSIDGTPEEVLLHAHQDNNQAATAGQAMLASSPGDVTVSMPSTIIDIKVTPGQLVKKGDALLVTEAMKMETEVPAPESGKILEIYCQKGQMVKPKELLLKIELSN